MSTNYVELFLKLYNYALKNLDQNLQSAVNFVLNKQGFQFHFITIPDCGLPALSVSKRIKHIEAL